MPIQTDIQRLAVDAIIELFVLDASPIGGSIARFHAGTNDLQQVVQWQGNFYSPFPIEADGFDRTASGAIPRPSLRISNIDSLIGALSDSSQDLVGARVTRKRTLLKYLDAANFTGGVNASADPTQEFPNDVYFIDRKVAHNKVMLEFELTAAFDVHGKTLPGRPVIQNVCWWKYRGPECGYAGTAMFTTSDASTTDATLDRCGKRLVSCALRANTARYGAFPGAALLGR